MRILNFYVVYQDSILRTGVCVGQSSHTLSMLRCWYSTRRLAQPHFVFVNCSDAVMSVFYYPFLQL